MEKNNIKVIARNKKAFHDYFVEKQLETGIELCGTEVKSVREGKVNLKDSWCSVVKGEMLLNGVHISLYDKGNIFNKDPMRVRRLLLHKREIAAFYAQVKQQGLTIIPLSIYLKGNLVKVEIGLCRGKKLYDKRASEAERESKININREMKERFQR